jgi:enoyl-CoA hydratase
MGTDPGDEPFVRYEVARGVATLTLDSPHNRNAISSRLADELAAGLDAAAADDAVRTVVLTHTGGTFCAGADLNEASGGGGGSSGDSADPAAARAAASRARTDAIVGILRRIVALPKPVVGRIDGHVRAGGMGLVAACDLVVAGPKASFALTEARLGLAPYVISLTLLPRLVPRAAERYYLTGERFDAAVAAEIGLITEAAVRDEPTEAVVARWCAELAQASPQGLAESKSLTTAAILEGFDRHAAELARRSGEAFTSEEAAEGMAAFLAKRPPRWAS